VAGSTLEAAKAQTVVAVVENKAGVLARVVGLFARRGYNIESLAVAPTEDERFSRITFVYDVGSAPVEQMLSQVNKLINVLSIEAIDDETTIERELLLATIRLVGNRGDVVSLVEAHSGTVVDESTELVTAMVAGSPAVLDSFEEQARRIGIVALQRSGRIALPKSNI
jgi:acetolactate synthase I/III small subunit